MVPETVHVYLRDGVPDTCKLVASFKPVMELGLPLRGMIKVKEDIFPDINVHKIQSYFRRQKKNTWLLLLCVCLFTCKTFL